MVIKYRLIAKQIVADKFNSKEAAEMEATRMNLPSDEWEQWEVEEYEED